MNKLDTINNEALNELLYDIGQYLVKQSAEEFNRIRVQEDYEPSPRHKRRMNRLFRYRVGPRYLPYPEAETWLTRTFSHLLYLFDCLYRWRKRTLPYKLRCLHDDWAYHKYMKKQRQTNCKLHDCPVEDNTALCYNIHDSTVYSSQR